MNILGFDYTGLNVQDLRSKRNSKEAVKVNTKMDILEITEIDSGIILNPKDKMLSIEFEYKVNYEPDFANVTIKGKILVSDEAKIIKQVAKDWKKKEIPKEFRLPLFNLILRKTTLKALELEDQVNLPLHFPIPSLQAPESA